jgi:anti-sigma regulatory factor (Ser/Thr protein kinase)
MTLNRGVRNERRMAPDGVGTTPAHCALFYRGEADYVQGVTDFLEPALERGEPIAVAAANSEPLADQLDEAGAAYQLLDMTEFGRNPARIIPGVEAMLANHGGQILHYVGESIWPGRSPQEIREAVRHEALVNLAWPEAPIRALCPYDQSNLDPSVLLDAQRTHPSVISDGHERPSRIYAAGRMPPGSRQDLDPPPAGALALGFASGDLPIVRAVVTGKAASSGLSGQRASDLVLAVNELATNTIRHAGGSGVLRVWDDAFGVVCQVEDAGHIDDPLAGQHVPRLEEPGGLGLWTVHQVCDLVEVRTAADGTVVRLHMSCV